MSSRAISLLLGACLAALLLASPASAAFGLKDLDITFSQDREDATRATEAGTHPFQMTTSLSANTRTDPVYGEVPDESVRDLRIELPPGFVGDPSATERCAAIDFATVDGSGNTACPNSTAVGVVQAEVGNQAPPGFFDVPVYNLEPPPGVAAKLGFVVVKVPVTIDVGVKESYPHNILATVSNVSQAALFYSAETTLWGNPTSDVHDPFRGHCLAIEDGAPGVLTSEGSCGMDSTGRPFLTLPRSCTGPLQSTFATRSWQNPGQWLRDDVVTDPGMQECATLAFSPTPSAAPTTERASSPSGLQFNLDVTDPGLTDPDGRAHSDIKRIVVTMPEGMTLNPSAAEGLAGCSPADLARETIDSRPGEGCPQASKVGTIEVETPLLRGELLRGEVFVATQDDNPFNSLIAIYIVIKHPARGILVKQAGKVEPNPQTGQLVSTFDDIPQVPFSHLRFRFREGGRSPLITPPSCGRHEIKALFHPWANPAASFETSAPFEVRRGIGGAGCPPPGQPFVPGFSAGTANNNAGSYSPFYMRLTRRDGDQDMTRFDATLPPGAVAKLAGIPWCPDAAIARARGREGKDELRSPSCPLASQIGSVQGGAGVGSQLTYVPGKVYLAGPVRGAPLSVVAIVPAVAGPFDVGTIVVRQALDLDPITGQAKVVSGASDSLPHILAGIPLKVRDIQVSVDRPDFTLNPTNCNPMAVLAGIWGGGSHVFSAHDDLPVLRQAHFQAASCASLGFEPKLAIKLRGGVKRGAHPALRAHVVPRPGDANFSRAVVTLPTSAFIDQSHFRTICTRVQFAAPPGHGAHCPPGARYGTARAWSPLIDGPVTGPVFLRSSDNNLPDLVAALTGPPSARVQVELSARIDSVKGGIRSIFTGIPDVPVSRFLLDMQGGKKGLFVNSRHLCHKPARNRAKSNLRGQNGRLSKTRPRVVATTCQKRRKAKRSRARGSHER